MKIGFAERDITPELPQDRNWKKPAAQSPKVHDPCKVRAAVFEAGGFRVALVGCDVESMLRGVVLAARADVADGGALREMAEKLRDKLGDAVVVVFNGPVEQPDHAARAARCAVDLQKAVAEMNARGAFPEIGTLAVGVARESRVGSQRILGSK